MDVTALIQWSFFQPFLAAFWYLIPMFMLLGIIKTAWFKGKAGEFQVNLSVRLCLDKTRYHLIKNVTLPTEDGTTQIDHVVVSEFGVFVVETKNMKGWIFGTPHQAQWTQKLFRFSHKFQNPLRQNHKHVKTLQVLLGLEDNQMQSVIVFIGNSTFKTPMPPNVTYGGGYISFIKSHTTRVLSPEQVQRAVGRIAEGRLAASFSTDRAHVRHVKERVANKASQKQCPRCSGGMVLRKVKRGANVGNAFWGCARFPACRGMLKAE